MAGVHFVTRRKERFTIDHILVGWAVVGQVWSFVLSWIRLPQCVPRGQDKFDDWWTHARSLLQQRKRKGFDSAVILVAWMVCKERNNRVFNIYITKTVFNNKQATIHQLVGATQDEGGQWRLAGVRCLEELLQPARVV